MSFNIVRNFETLISDEVSVYIRAVNLYRLQTWILAPNSLRLRRAATLLVAARLIEHIQYLHLKKSNSLDITLEQMSQNADFKQLFNRYICKPYAWTHLTELPSAREIENKLLHRTQRADVVSALIEFSVRFRPGQDSTRSEGGIRMAEWVVANTDFCRIRLKKTRISELWKRHRPSAPFLYLTHFQKLGHERLRLTNPEFARRLLRQAKQVEPTLELLSAYNTIVSILRDRGYRFHHLNFQSPKSPELYLKPLPANILEAIRAYEPGERG